MKKEKKEILNLISIIFVFVLLSYLTQNNIELFQGLIKVGTFGILIYLMLTISAIVLAPISSVPLIPLATKMWGWKISAFLNALGWTIGATIAFLIARNYGSNLVKRILPIESLHRVEEKIPKKNIFWGLVFLRMAFPVDVLSYAIGLFSKINLKTYTLATAIGVIPFAILLSYVSEISFYYQLTAALLFGAVIIISTIYVKKRKPKKK